MLYTLSVYQCPRTATQPTYQPTNQPSQSDTDLIPPAGWSAVMCGNHIVLALNTCSTACGAMQTTVALLPIRRRCDYCYCRGSPCCQYSAVTTGSLLGSPHHTNVKAGVAGGGWSEECRPTGPVTAGLRYGRHDELDTACPSQPAPTFRRL